MLPRLSHDRAQTFSGAVFLVGLGFLFLINHLWPGILFVVGLTILVQGLVEGRAWHASKGAFWTIGLGLIFEIGANGATFIGLLLMLVGLGTIASMFQPPPFLEPKPKPHVDSTWE